MTALRQAKAVSFVESASLPLSAEFGEGWARSRSVTFVSCTLCAAIVVRDGEGANEALHRQSHVDVAEFLAALRDGKADTGVAW